jgi:hypothetical protein
MAQRRTAYRWTIRHEDPLMAGMIVDGVEEIVRRWIELYPNIFSDGWVAGDALGILQVGIVVTRRDRWECQRQARNFARALAVRARVRMVEVINPEPANLPARTASRG